MIIWAQLYRFFNLCLFALKKKLQWIFDVIHATVADKERTRQNSYLFGNILTATPTQSPCRWILPPVEPASIDATTETTAALRRVTGKLGFSAAALALLVAARYQRMVGGALKKILPVSFFLGIAMLLIWVDSGTAFHAGVGTIFFLWLMANGSMLASGKTERHFVEKFNL